MFLIIMSMEHFIFFLITLIMLSTGCVYEFLKINDKIKNRFLILSAIIYILCSFSILFWIRLNENGELALMILVAHVWSSDVGGYLIGSIFGKKQMTKLSPKKTWEGFFGSFLFCLITSIFYKSQIHQIFNVNYIILSFFLCLSAIIGDLIMSYWKRINNQIKSGYFLPGHGGFLDRLDSLLFSSYIYMLFF